MDRKGGAARSICLHWNGGICHQVRAPCCSFFTTLTDRFSFELVSTLNSLSEEACDVLRVLACLPSRGVDVNLLVDVLQKPATTVRTLLDEAATLGSVHITPQQKVEFIHDKHHQAALNLIAPDDRPRLCVTLANKLENRGDGYIFSRADLIIEATALDPGCYPIRKKAEISALAEQASEAELTMEHVL